MMVVLPGESLSSSMDHITTNGGHRSSVGDVLGGGMLSSSFEGEMLKRVHQVLRRGGLPIRSTKPMTRVWLPREVARCNDDSNAGYVYIIFYLINVQWPQNKLSD